MIELGKIQKLEVLRDTSVGMYLNAKDELDDTGVLLPTKQIPEGTEIGDEIEVFVYRDSEDRIICTTNSPKLTLGEMEYLEVVDTSKIGAFLDWGLEKDLFLPFNEMTNKVVKGRKYLVSLYIDKSDRLSATMNIGDFLELEGPFNPGDKVDGIIYEVTRERALVAIDRKYHGVILGHDLYGDFRCGNEINARVVDTRKDGKIRLSLRKLAFKQMGTDADTILERLKQYGGTMYLHDKSDPEHIKDELQMSKKGFKRAVGKLLKENKIEFIEGGMKLK
ncbi:CvfB family protein [Anaeromicrobium sediminis]|uniref:RNA-binding protein n=1 Tax=Anaeromicrobium sediminis TaxID=1478221 RepID=A0A267MMB7_9FIRM|nr:S1-like domain-containing RNA-binding protein [Anaeromicrobium sediminis]PAB60577.1 RNA-binding protein [Anaeromicrobium sediminis]